MIALYALIALMGLATAGWLVILAINVSKIRTFREIKAKDASNFPSDAPLVSILVPARNEGDRLLDEAIRSMASQDYPSIEVIVVDDRSTDNTFDILSAIASDEPSIRVVRGGALPNGWLGKPWALEQAKRQARGRWLLATDADIVFEPQAVRTGMSIAFRGRYDAVSFAPGIGGESVLTRAILPVAAWMIAVVFPIDKTNDPASPVALGCGAFILMRREAHDAVGGYEAIKAEVADDVATARALKRAGRRFRLESAQSLLFTPMYESLGELWQGFSKNAFEGAGTSLAVVVRNSLANLVTTTLPMVLAPVGIGMWAATESDVYALLGASALAAYLSMVAAFAPVYRTLGASPLLSLLSGPANLFMVLILINSAWKNVTGRGVRWKGQRVNTARV